MKVQLIKLAIQEAGAVLDSWEIDHLLDHGYVRIDEAFSSEVAVGCTETIFPLLRSSGPDWTLRARSAAHENGPAPAVGRQYALILMP